MCKSLQILDLDGVVQRILHLHIALYFYKGHYGYSRVMEHRAADQSSKPEAAVDLIAYGK